MCRGPAVLFELFVGFWSVSEYHWDVLDGHARWPDDVGDVEANRPSLGLGKKVRESDKGGRSTTAILGHCLRWEGG